MFQKAGTVMVRVDQVTFAEPKFAKNDPSAFDICVHGVSLEDENQSDWWHGEMSNNQCRGAMSHLTQKEATLESLRRIGFESDDLTELESFLVGEDIPFRTKATEAKDGSGKVYYNVVGIGAGGEQITEIDKDTVKARMAALMGGGAEPSTGDTTADEAKQEPKKAAAKPAAKAKPATTAKPAATGFNPFA